MCCRLYKDGKEGSKSFCRFEEILRKFLKSFVSRWYFSDPVMMNFSKEDFKESMGKLLFRVIMKILLKNVK